MLLRGKSHTMFHVLQPAFQIMIALTCLAMLIWPRVLANKNEDDASNHDQL